MSIAVSCSAIDFLWHFLRILLATLRSRGATEYGTSELHWPILQTLQAQSELIQDSCCSDLSQLLELKLLSSKVQHTPPTQIDPTVTYASSSFIWCFGAKQILT